MVGLSAIEETGILRPDIDKRNGSLESKDVLQKSNTPEFVLVPPGSVLLPHDCRFTSTFFASQPQPRNITPDLQFPELSDIAAHLRSIRGLEALLTLPT